MADYSREYLELLAEKYPNRAAACSEIVNLRAILSLPKGTEHFISDLHGEYGAVRHILNNCSGVILEKVRRLYEQEVGEERCRALCSLIYYPREELNCLREQDKLSDGVLRDVLERLRTLAEMLSGKYTRSYVRKQMPAEWSFVLDELLHVQRDEEENQLRYHDTLLDAIVETGSAEEVIVAMSELIKRLAVERLHIVGDIFDRGSEPARLLDALMEHPNIDIQWGNHDILWLGAAAGSPACIFTVLRISVDYGNTNLLERRYGISLRPLTEFSRRVYGSASGKMLHHALNTLGFKLEGQIIKRHPGYGMDSRLMLERIDFEHNTVRLDDGVYPLNTSLWPTIDPGDPYRLTAEEEALVEEYVFRKQLIDRMGIYGGKTAVLLSALLFGLYHGNFSQFFYAFGLGLAFGYIYLNTGRLRCSVIAHMCINFMGSVFAPALLQQISPEALSGSTMEALANPWFRAYYGYALLLVLCALAGLVLLCMSWRNLRFESGALEPPKGKRFQTCILNAGMLLSILAGCALMAVSLLT